MMTDRKPEEVPAHVTCAGIYVHIPFCIRKCAYCDFLSFPASGESRARYVEVLKEEIKKTCTQMQNKGERIATVYFGGGTPSVLSAEQIGSLMDVLKREGRLESQAEVTLEMNPKTASAGKLTAFRRAGINRLSIGAQSFLGQELKLLGRVHTPEDFFLAYQEARKAGFDNISLDLMSGLPGQTLQTFQESLKTAISLQPEHISAYSLILEEGTPFFETYGKNWSEEHEEIDRLMYEETNRILQEAGYHRYEISNYAKPGRESRHNTSYWTGVPYYGCGLGASSLIQREDGQWIRSRNQTSFEEYLKGNHTPEEEILLSKQDRMEEFMFLGLRLVEGIRPEEFVRRFEQDFDEIYGRVAAELIRDGLLWKKEGRLGLTPRGLDLSNYCFEKFLLD